MNRTKTFVERFEEEVSFTRGWGEEVQKILQKGKEIAKVRLKEDGVDVDIDELYTASELEDHIYDILEGDVSQCKVASKMISYISIPEIVRDEVYSGYIDYIDVNIPGAEHTVRYFYYTR